MAEARRNRRTAASSGSARGASPRERDALDTLTVEQRRELRRRRRELARKRRRRRMLVTMVCLLATVALIVASVASFFFGSSRSQDKASATAPLSSALIEGCATLPAQLYEAHLLRNDQIQTELKAHDLLYSLTTEQRVAQLFFVTPESLLAGYTDDTVTAAGEMTLAALQEHPVGGIIYFQSNLVNAEQTTQMLANTKQYALEACGVPILLDVDEEGGTVSRVGGNEGFDIANVGNMCYVGATGDVDYANEVAQTIGSYLHDLGFTADFAPVADVANNPESNTMYWRSFGADANLVAQMVAAQVKGFTAQNIICCAKHFPGIGAAEGDSHLGSIYTQKTADEMAEMELVPFQAAIDAGVPMVMVGHISCPAVTGNDLPASVSPEVMQGLLRERLGFSGVVVTDSLSMGAIVELYGYDRVAVEAFRAGADALLMPADFNAAYQGMLDAVESGEISQERLNLSAYRIILMKLRTEESAA